MTSVSNTLPSSSLIEPLIDTAQWQSPFQELLGDHSNPTFSLNHAATPYTTITKSGQFQHRFGYNSQLSSPYNYHRDWRPQATFSDGVFLPPLPPQGFNPRTGFIPHQAPHCFTPVVRTPSNPVVYYPVMVVRPSFPTPPLGFRQVVAARPPPSPAVLPPPCQDMQLLRAKLVSQIEYYFSKNNLVTDLFLRLNMDEEGWVPIKLIAGFRRVKKLTGDMKLVVDAMRSSSVVEVVGEKVRKRGDWSFWVMQLPAESVDNVESIEVQEIERSHGTAQAC